MTRYTLYTTVICADGTVHCQTAGKLRNLDEVIRTVEADVLDANVERIRGNNWVSITFKLTPREDQDAL